MADKVKVETENTEVKASAVTPALFKCPNDNCTKFHKAEFGELVAGAFVVTRATYRCVMCHTEYESLNGEIVRA